MTVDATKPISGVGCLLKVNVAPAGQAAIYAKAAGQQDATLKINGKEIDTTSKDSQGWEENIPGIKSWSVDCTGLYIEDDAAADALETAFINDQQILANLVMPSGKVYSGLATITSLEIGAPNDKEMSKKLNLKGSGALGIIG